ncbi:MAG TPA: acetyl-CoA C-acetyltransferase [Thermodesulfobacteriota bacterium]
MDMASSEVVILGGARTPIGTFGGTLKDLSAVDLGVVAAKAAIERSGVEPGHVQQAIVGNVIQASSVDGAYLARHIALRAGCPVETPALTVNRLCGSGFQAVVSAAEQILLGEAEVVLAGGTESMSQAPHIIRGARFGLGLGQGKLEDALWDALTDTLPGMPMGITAENLAAEYGIGREEVDRFAYESQQRARAAIEAGRLGDEIVAVEVTGKKGTTTFTTDEHPRPNTTLEALAKLKPVFKPDGVVTAGNASGIGDGAAMLVLAPAETAARRGARPLGRLVSWGLHGCRPEIMGIGPVQASKNALRKAGLRLDQMDLVEINEAFAAQYLAVERALGLDRARTNVNGGAIALSHPVGMSGARLTLTILHELRRRKGRYGLASACIGGGQGIAVVVEAY